MKLRTGFVSNSSSSSFCIKRPGVYPTVWDLAQDMILMRGWDNDEELFAQIERDKMEEGLKKTQNVAFNTCNYPTYIRSFPDAYAVQTCNNHSWWKLDLGFDTDYPQELRDLANEYGGKWGCYSAQEYCEFHLNENGAYWWPEFRLLGSDPDWKWGEREKWKKKHKECSHWPLFIETNDGVVCAYCRRDELRREKEA